MTGYIDTHIHLDFLEAPQIQLAEARQAGVRVWVVPGVSGDRWAGLIATVEMHADVYAAPGVHPQAAESWQKSSLEELRRLMRHPRVVALGEVGLDRMVACPWRVQEEVFLQMIRLARETDKPLLIHARRCAERVLEILRQEEAGRVGGIFHAFSGSLETARKIIDAGFALGIGGVVTWPTARRLPQVVCEVPAEALVLETDAPDMTPEPYRGQANRPAYLVQVAERLADLRGWTPAETARITSENSRRILRLA